MRKVNLDTANVIDIRDGRVISDERQMTHLMSCTTVGCLRCQPEAFLMRRMARQFRVVA